jgi:DNA-binding GntR family transcriptional regulator
MATTASVIEQIYKAIKADVCTGGVLPGARVNIAAYCGRFGVSKSPVRNALYRLVGEDLLEAHPHDGFYRPRVIEQSLFDLFVWNEHALHLAFDQIEAASPTPAEFPSLPDASDNLVADVEHLFAAVAALSANTACQREILHLNDQLRPIRRQEGAQLADLESELDTLASAWREGDISGLRHGVSAYHARRRESVRQLVALAYRA